MCRPQCILLPSSYFLYSRKALVWFTSSSVSLSPCMRSHGPSVLDCFSLWSVKIYMSSERGMYRLTCCRSSASSFFLWFSQIIKQHELSRPSTLSPSFQSDKCGGLGPCDEALGLWIVWGAFGTAGAPKRRMLLILACVKWGLLCLHTQRFINMWIFMVWLSGWRCISFSTFLFLC